jgi:putative DNA primase/helicase
VEALGPAATTNPGGAGKWLDVYNECLRGADVIILPDNDEAGRAHAQAAAKSLAGTATSIKILNLPVSWPHNGAGAPEKADVTDWIAAGGTVEELWRLAEAQAPIEERTGHEDAPHPIFARVINPADWEGLPIPEREWVVPDYIPHKTVTTLSGDDGQGKSLLALQLAIARALAKEWIGLLPEPGKTLVLSTEDDSNEMHRRCEPIRQFHKARWTDLSDMGSSILSARIRSWGCSEKVGSSLPQCIMPSTPLWPISSQA